MGWKHRGARALALGVALLAVVAGAARANDASELLQQDLIVMRVQRGTFPDLKLWLLPSATESLRVGPAANDAPRLYTVVPNFLRTAGGKVTDLKNPRNIRNFAAYYLQPGDRVYCAKAAYQAKTGRWVLDGIQRIAEQQAPKLVRGRRKVAEDPLEVQMLTDKKAYRPGEPVRMTLRARNRTQKPMDLVFPTGETHAISIYGAFREVWRYATLEHSDGKHKKVTLKPGETLEFTEVWDQTTTEGKPADPGRYFAGGKVISEGRAILSDARVPFRIKPDPAQTTADAAAGGN